MSKLLLIAASTLAALQLLLTGLSPVLVSASSGSLTATFNFQVPSQADGLVVDFGDGTSQVVSSAACLLDASAPCSADKPITHTYNSPGTYTATLHVSDCNEALVATQTVTVK